MASGNMKTIKRRIKSINSTMQITKAMELVASSKLRRAKGKAETGRPFFRAMNELMESVASCADVTEGVYGAHSVIKNRLFIVIAGDRGLAGGYNNNIFKLVADEIKKAIEYYEKRAYPIVAEYAGITEQKVSVIATSVSTIVSDLYRSEETDEVVLFYTEFVSPLIQKPAVLPLLPLKKTEQPQKARTPMRYDPSPQAVMARLVPLYLMSQIRAAIFESFTSEQGARRMAMENATDNAQEMLNHLSLQYNRARQEKITNEINEIASAQ
jgi:F-type H+-transporting ATPase subunit gamma